MSFLSNLFGKPLPSLTPKELSERLSASNKPFVLDVRQPEEYRGAHIAGAKLVPLGELSKHINELPKNKEIVCVCASGSRSHSATNLLIDAGSSAINMTGGMFTWQRAGLPVKKGTAG